MLEDIDGSADDTQLHPHLPPPLAGDAHFVRARLAEHASELRETFLTRRTERDLRR